MPTLAVIIPTLNEAARLPALLRQLHAQSGVSLEIVVADGGSTDATVELARRFGAGPISPARGRAAQMNAGARAAQADVLLFLHADSALPAPTLLRDALLAWQAQCARLGTHRVAGHFALRFDRVRPGHEFFFRYLEGKTRLNRPYTINGDQGLLIARRYFEELGGYDERLPFLEDQRLAARIFASGHWLLLPGELRTSARRFEAEGHRARYTLMALIMAMHAAGVDEFFRRAPRVYAAQGETARLDLRPYAALIRRLLREQGAAGAGRTIYRAGRFVRENAWQLFYCCDLRRADAAPRWLPFHDRFVRRVIANPVTDGLAGLLAALWFFAVLPITGMREGS